MSKGEMGRSRKKIKRLKFGQTCVTSCVPENSMKMAVENSC